MQCECCLEPCYAKDMAELSCHHIAHKDCINVLMADPVYAKRPCPVKHHCDGVNLLNIQPNAKLDCQPNPKICETKEQIVARLRARIETINSLSAYLPDDRTVEYYAALMVYQQLNARLQSDEHLISCKNNKLRYFKYTKVNDIFTVTVYVDKIVQYSLKFGQPCCRIIPHSYKGIADFAVADGDDTCLLVKDGVIYPHIEAVNDRIMFKDYDNKLEIAINLYRNWARIDEFSFYDRSKPLMMINAKQLLCDQHYAKWLNQYQYELKNLECTLDRLDYH